MGERNGTVVARQALKVSSSVNKNGLWKSMGRWRHPLGCPIELLDGFVF